MGTLILPGQNQQPRGPVDVPHGVYFLRNPANGLITRYEAPRHEDSIRFRLFNEHGGRYERATEADWRAQAVELAELQGRPLPAWAMVTTEAEETAAPVKPAAKSGR